MIVRSFVSHAAEKFETSTRACFALLTVLYVAMLLPFAGRPLWHDELFTFYIGNAPSFQQFLEDVRRLDLNPPMIYVVTRVANHLFGESPIATRVPSMLAFYGFSLLLFLYLIRKIGRLYAVLTILLFWSGVFFYYAAEARPYALILLFSALVLLSYDWAVSHQQRRWALGGVAFGTAAVILTHVFAPFFLAPFFFAEVMRSLRHRAADWRLWVAMCLPLACVGIYFPLIRRYEGGLFPPAFQPSLFALARFFWLVPRLSFWAFLAVLLGTLIAWRPLKSGQPQAAGQVPARWTLTDRMLASTYVLMPAVVSVALLKTHGAFWDRYCITSAVAVYVLCIALLQHIARRQHFVSIAALAILVPVLLLTKVALPLRAAAHVQPNAAQLASIRPELPLVCASGVTFLEMDHNEGESVKKRLFYLMDRTSAIRYAHATLFEGFDVLKQYFPIKSNVDQLSHFEQDHRHFLVLSRPNFPENWLLPKLRDDHAEIRAIGTYNIPYEDRDLWEVTLPPAIGKAP